MSDFSPVLFAACVTPFENQELYDAAYALATDNRRQKADRLRFPEDKRLSLGAEILLRGALRSVGEADLPSAFAYGENGKPYLADSGLHFNLSHSGDWVVCAIADCDVGCDIERIRPIDLMLAKRYFFASEYENIAAKSAEKERSELFFRYWTLKESFMKATGLGMRLPLDAFEICIGDEISVRQALDGRSYRFAEYSVIPDYCCALCAAGGAPDPLARIVDLKELIM